MLWCKVKPEMEMRANLEGFRLRFSRKIRYVVGAVVDSAKFQNASLS